MRLVFVSSTFKDMQFERDELRNRLTPQINNFLIQYGESVRFTDLRWGVNTSELESEESSKKVLKICLDEIDNARPYMIVFIGERYGWIPSSTLLEETMKIKDIKDVPLDVSVTNLEIEYGALLNPDYEGRILFYIRKPFDTSKMNEEERKIYENESPLHKQKLEALKKKITDTYPDYVRYYDVSYDENKKQLIGLNTLMDQIYEDLTRVFKIDYDYLSSLPSYKRAIMNSEVYFESLYKYAYFRDNLIEELEPNEEVIDDYYHSQYDEIQCMRFISSAVGTGRKTSLACLYKISKDKNPNYTLPFVYGLDNFTTGEDALISTLINFYEEKLNHKIEGEMDISHLANIIKYNDENNKYHFEIFIMNESRDVIGLLKLLESEIETMYHTTFYLMNDSDIKEYSPYLLFYPHNRGEKLLPLNDEEKIEVINQICKSKHKELSKVVINHIIQKEASNIPQYLSLVVERLLMLDSEDFKNIRKMGDGMKAINDYMIDIVDHLGNDVFSICKEILNELAERINYDLVMRVLYFMSHRCFIKPSEIQDFFHYANYEYNELDLSLLLNSVPSLFAPLTRYDYLVLGFQVAEEAAKELTEEKGYKDLYKVFLKYVSEVKVDIIKKLIIGVANEDYEIVFECYLRIASRLINDHESEDFCDYMDKILYIFSEKSNENFSINRFVNYCLDKDKILSLEDHYSLLSLLFYPYISDTKTEKSLDKMFKGILDIMLYLLKRYKKEKDNKRLDEITRLTLFIAHTMDEGAMFTNNDGYDSDKFIEVMEKLDECISDDKEALMEIAKHIPFNSFKYLRTYADLNYINSDYENKYDANKFKDYYLNKYDLDNIPAFIKYVNERKDDLTIDDYLDASGEYHVLSMLIDLYLTKNTSGKRAYKKKFKEYIDVLTILLNKCVFRYNKGTYLDRYLITPIFEFFINLIQESDIDVSLYQALFDVALQAQLKYLICEDITNLMLVRMYAKVLTAIEYVGDSDFAFAYPLIHKVLLREDGYTDELFDVAIELLSFTRAMDEFNRDIEFYSLLDIYKEHNGICLGIYVYIGVYLQRQERDIKDDQLIDMIYALFNDDFEFKNKTAYKKWKKDYLKAISYLD